VARRRKKSSKRVTRVRSGRRWLTGLLILLTLIAAVSLLVLDAMVYQKFSGKKWSLASHVYSRALELYPGQALARKDLQWELEKLGYQRVTAAKKPGQYSVAAERIELFSRGFEFWDGKEPAQLMRLSFAGQKIRALTDATGKPVDLARLEPMVMGGIYPAHKEDRELVKLSQLPPSLADALLAVEDQNFYDHYGVSFRGIARAMLANLKQGRVAQGGSTLTQQLVKNFYLSHERTLSRKLMEVVMAVMLEMHFSKDEILETYINEVYLGQSGARAVHGFGLASRHYFQQSITDLDVHQVALLVGMVKGASYYNPWRQPERAMARRNLVLGMMAEQGLLDAERARLAQQQPLDVMAQSDGGGRWQYPAYLELVKRQLRQDYKESDLQTEGLRIFTHFDPQVQRKLEQRMTSRIDAERERLEKDESYARELVREELVPLVDFKRITRMVMGEHFDQASRDQKYEFLEVFKNSLINTYASGVTLYQGQEIRVLPMREEDRKGNYARVRLEGTTNDGKVIPVFFTLFQSDDQWKVVNVYVNGLDLRDVYRAQFAQSMQQLGDLDKVIDSWSAESADLEEKVDVETGSGA